MPTLHAYADASGFFAKAHLRGRVVNFQLTSAAVQRLTGAARWGAGGVYFFESLPTEQLKILGVSVVAGEHPGSDYYAAELDSMVEKANEAAKATGILVKFYQIMGSRAASGKPSPHPHSVEIFLHVLPPSSINRLSPEIAPLSANA